MSIGRFLRELTNSIFSTLSCSLRRDSYLSKRDKFFSATNNFAERNGHLRLSLDLFRAELESDNNDY